MNYTLLVMLSVAYLQAASAINSLQANFIQNINTDGVNMKYEGVLYVNADSRAYWRYDKPVIKEIYINKDKITVYEPDSKQVMISNNENINFIKILRDMKQNGNHLTSILDGITFNITLKDNKPRKIEYIDKLDNKMSITLSNVSINGKIDDSIFDAKIPEDAEIIMNNR